MIVNVQIKGLKYDKPRPGGPSSRPGYGKSIECEKFLSEDFVFLSLDTKSKVAQKSKNGRVKRKKVKKKRRRCRRCSSDGRGPDKQHGESQISPFLRFAGWLSRSKINILVKVVVKWCKDCVNCKIPLLTNPKQCIYDLCVKYNFLVCEKLSDMVTKVTKVNSRLDIKQLRKIVNKSTMYITVKNIVIEMKRNANKFNYSISLLHFIPTMLISITKITNIKSILLILLILLCAGIEPNPGPPRKTKITTYNCNGLGDQNKLRRLLLKVNNEVSKGAIVFLQETHIVDTKVLESSWKNKFLSNCKKTNAAGVIILFSDKYEINYVHKDDEGRAIVAVISNEERTLILANAYFPNDHKAGIKFAENLYLKIIEAQVEYPNSVTICAGDFNLCMSKNDSLDRKETKNETLLADVVRGNNKVIKLEDSYRSVHKNGGYTWKRGSTYSRLDYIFTSNSLLHHITGAEVDWAFETSDHAAVRVDIIFEEPQKGPGITKINTNILEDKNVELKIGQEIEEMMKQVQTDWNPHLTLEFLKVTIRSIFSSNVSEIKKRMNYEVNEKEEELNQIEHLKIKLYEKPNILNEDRTKRIEVIDKAITTLKMNLTSLRKNLNDKLTFTTKAKWFEYGEKSNKYFLNLNKKKQAQKSINQIKNGNETFTGQEQVTKGVSSFYRELYSEKVPTGMNDSKFYEHCPKLSEDQKRNLDKELSIKELRDALATCTDSAPGPDGIPYSVYKTYWKISGPIILAAWKYSLVIGKMPPSHLESVITLLPKEGKDNKDIKNWRPITLSNCDAKIITKTLSLRTAKVLETIIDPSQTAYVPGRSIADNLRTNFFYKKYCQKNNIGAVLVSLDAKKAFDSVSHQYIEETLEAYGFGPVFLNTFKILYREITARVLVNGFFSEAIKIERGVKQGDALSCAIFIICIDPLLRNINNNRKIKGVQIKKKNKYSKELNFKGAAYADDISIICEKESIQEVFNEYERITNKSGLELNADKTEILSLNTKIEETYNVLYNQNIFQIKTVTSLKICGLNYCCEYANEYKLNVLDKIDKLTYKIKAWSQRHLTMEGKTLIVKTFGLSQLIYNMQAYEFERREITSIERTIFKFLWSTSENQNGIDRIKRSIMKNEYSKGGMNVTDVECLNSSLKFKQFIRAQESKHVISKIQSHLLGGDGESKCITQEYSMITDYEPICQSAQETMNRITDHRRKLYNEVPQDVFETDRNMINDVSSISLNEYLKRKNHALLLCMSKILTDKGISTLGELIQAYEYENDENINKTMKLVMSAFPRQLIEIAKCFIDGINSNDENVKYIMLEKDTWKETKSVTVKELQLLMKTVLNRTENQDFNTRLGITSFKVENIERMRRTCHNAKLRNIYF